MFLSYIGKLLAKKKYKAIKTFTYYLPSPPERKTGYQEKEFDRITAYLISKNFDILEFKLQSCANDKSAGLWILCLLGARTNTAAQMEIEIDYHEISQLRDQSIKLHPSIEHEH